MTQSSKGVFLSYASEDAGAAKHICDTLRSAGIEVWFDQSELRGGDAWDQKIRQQIRDCALFVPIISAHTQARPEGYFRLEWKLAVDRSHLMAAEKAFLVPVVVDATTEPEALVPVQFRDVQWTRTQAGEVQAAFVDRIAALVNQPVATPVRNPGQTPGRGRPRRLPTVLAAISVAVGVALVIAISMRGGWLSHTQVPKVETGAAAPVGAPSTGAISEKSVAVLPFVDMSEKKDQEYFSDGLTEELIDMLAKIPDLRVPARTSSFYFKSKSEDIPTIARRLMVAHVLEGSVRKSGNHLRITAQLIRADNGYHLWSESYDRQMRDVFVIQDEIAGAVVKALKVSLLDSEGRRAVTTTNSEAYTLYLQALSMSKRETSGDSLRALEYLQQAVRLDPTFALAWARMAELYADETIDWTQVFKPKRTPDAREASGEWTEIFAQACRAGHSAAEKAVTLAPMLADAHTAMAFVRASCDWDWAATDAELKKARELDPGSARATRAAAILAICLGRLDEARQLSSRAVAQDPLGTGGWEGQVEYRRGMLEDAQAAYRKYIELYPTATAAHYFLGGVLLARGEPQAALAEFEREASPQYRQTGLPLALDALGRRRDADRELAAAELNWADSMAYQIACIYAARNDIDRAMSWLERAYRQHDTGLVFMKGDPLLKNLLPDRRYKAFLRKMNLPG